MTDLHLPFKENGRTIWRVGISLALVLTVLQGGIYIGRSSEEVAHLRARLERHELRLVEFDRTLKRNAAALSRIEGLLEASILIPRGGPK